MEREDEADSARGEFISWNKLVSTEESSHFTLFSTAATSIGLEGSFKLNISSPLNENKLKVMG
jgi:hypothetical protein